jgi:two-component system sensor histidine kinase UhpB
MIVGAVLLGGLAVQLFSPNQFKYENEQQANSARAVAGALNAALATAHNPEQIFDAFAGSLGSAEAIKYLPPGVAMEHPIKRVYDGNVPAWFTSLLAIPELGTAYPIKIGTTHVGSIVFNPDLSADIFEKWMAFLAIVSFTSVLMLLAALSAYFATGAAARPLTELRIGLTRIRKGDYDNAIPITGPPEIRKSCEEANELAATLKRLSRDNRELLRKCRCRTMSAASWRGSSTTKWGHFYSPFAPTPQRCQGKRQMTPPIPGRRHTMSSVRPKPFSRQTDASWRG